MTGEVLTVLGVVHRKQQTAIFVSEGATSGGGLFAPLNPRYAARKRKLFGRKKILQLSGDMKARFTLAGNPGYIQKYVGTEAKGVFQFGAASDVAAAHLYGNPALAPRQSAAARSVFGGTAPRLPVRDMISKTATQMGALKDALTAWYAARAKRVIRATGGGR
jgi:hypothetical protein